MVRLAALVVGVLVAAPCLAAQRPERYAPARQPTAQVGRATWYGERFHGRLTASGEQYDMFQMTAAHRVLPLGARVKVTNTRTGKSVTVRINDRGPHVKGAIIDLSYAAAKALGLIAGPRTAVRVEVLPKSAPRKPEKQVASAGRPTAKTAR